MPPLQNTQPITAKVLLDRVEQEIEREDAKRLEALEEISIGYRLGESVEFGADLPLFIRKLIGFSLPENTHQWSLGQSSSIELLLDHPFQDPVLLCMRFTPFVSPSKKSQTVNLGLNGALIASWDAYQEDDYFAIIPPLRDPKDKTLDINIFTPDASRPSDVFDSEDGRTLGIALSRLCIRNLAEFGLPTK